MSSIRIKEIVPLSTTLNILSGGNVSIQNTTVATNTNGALKVTGGLSILASGTGSSLNSPDGLYVAGGGSVNGNLFVGGVVNFQNTTATTNTSTGSCIISGGLVVKDKIVFQHNYGTQIKFESTSRPDVTITNFNQTSAPNGVSLNICNVTSDGTYSSGLRLWSLGSNTSATNQEYIEFAYNPSVSAYSILSKVSGSGSLKPIKLSSTSGVTDQITINTNQTVSFNTTQLTILGTNDSTSSTSGAAVISGGLTVQKAIYAKTLVIDGNTEEKMNQTTVSIANNQSSAATLFTMTNSKCFKCIALVQIQRSSGGTLIETFDIIGYNQNTTGWSISYTSQGDITGLALTINTSTGALQYTTPSITNFSSATFYYKVYSINPSAAF